MGARLGTLDLDDQRWHAFVAHHPDAMAFHHPAWAAALAECYGFAPRVVAALSDTGDVAAGVPVLEVHHRLQAVRWIALPFTDHCRVLGSGAVGTAEFTAALAAFRTDAAIPCVEVR